MAGEPALAWLTRESADERHEMVGEVTGRDDAGRTPTADQRDVAEAPEGHLVDGDRDRVVAAQDDGVAPS